MYARPSAIAPVAAPARRGFNGPLAAICCLAIVLFLIAATIVIALIPIYIPAKNAEAGDTQDYYFLMDPNEALGDDGNLGTDAQTPLAAAISNELGFDPDALQFDDSVVAGPPDTDTRRRRRDLSLSRSKRQSFPSQSCRGKGHFRRRYCRGFCRLRSYDFYIEVTIPYGGQNLFRRFRVRIFLFPIVFPAIRGSTTTVSTSSGSNTGSTITTIISSNATTTVAATTTTTEEPTGGLM